MSNERAEQRDPLQPVRLAGGWLLLILGLAIYGGWLPAGGWDWSWQRMVLPVVTLALPVIAYIARLTRGSMIEVLNSPFVRTARAKGVSPATIELRHVLRNALLPIITLLGLSLPALFSGTVFVEVIFAWPGMGRVRVDAVSGRDYPVVMAITTIFAALVVLGNLLADILYGVADPRINERRNA